MEDILIIYDKMMTTTQSQMTFKKAEIVCKIIVFNGT